MPAGSVMFDELGQCANAIGQAVLNKMTFVRSLTSSNEITTRPSVVMPDSSTISYLKRFFSLMPCQILFAILTVWD